MQGDLLLDLGRGDVLATDLEHVLEPPEEHQPARSVEPSVVAGRHPARGAEGRRGLDRVVVVSVAQGHPAQLDLPVDLSAQHDPGVGVDDPHLGPWEGLSAGLDSHVEGIAEAVVGDRPAPSGSSQSDNWVAWGRTPASGAAGRAGRR
jgi:hypothetical protein